MSGIARHHSEWVSLIEVSGPFLTLPVLIRVFPQGLPKVDGKKLGRLRAAYEEWANAQDAKAPDASALHATWVQLVLRELLEFDDQTLRSGDGLPSGLDVRLLEHHETLRPSMAIVEPSGRAKAGTPRLLVAVWPSNQDLESAVPAARWAASPLERMTQLCRSTGVRLGLVTNGERWTVVDAPVGQTAGYASWYAGLWLQEPITLAAFDALLGVRRFFAVANTDTIEALLDESVAFQQEVTDQLGYQVRRAVEVLAQALDRADLDRKRELLRDVPPARLYDAALTVMMRLVFIFCAEERGLLLLGDETYDANYAVSTLRALLREEADRVGVEVLERRQDAWARLLATFRAVHGGVEHEALRLPALGGSLFDPDRFPFLEGRAAGTSWLDTLASPLPIDNRTVLHLLEALQLLRTRGDGGTSEARKLSYRALDIEQIGHVYEGLLDHVAVRVDADTLGLAGTKDKEPELSLDELNRERRHGRDGLIGFLKEHTGRSTSALRNDLDAELDEVAEQRLLVACGNDKALVTHIAPYHALIRKDVWGYPQIYRAGSFMITGGSERRQTGTHYTPKSLTEQIVTETLEPLVYVGPAEGKPRHAWKLRSAVELLDLKICDMAMGSGAFLVQVCRWLAERVVEAWEDAERHGGAISAEGEVLEKAAGHDLLPPDREERLSYARRLVAERCIFGVDINPMAVELAKLSLWLVTLAKGRPFGFLDHNLRSGDSLLGIHRLEQLTELCMTPNGKGQRRLFGQRVERAVHEAIEVRKRLRSIPIRDISDIEAMATLDAEARSKLMIAERVADALLGVVLAASGQSAERTGLDALAIEADRVAEGDAKALVALGQRASLHLANDSPDGSPRRPFHWPLEFPEVFAEEGGGFDAFVSNPPFMGGRKISSNFGDAFEKALKKLILDGAKGSVNLVAYFVVRSLRLLCTTGSAGFIATDSIKESDTRTQAFARVFERATAYFGLSSFPWPGTAGVHVSVVVFSMRPWRGSVLLDGARVDAITTMLEPGSELEQPHSLASNAGFCSDGVKVQGIGFVLDESEAATILAKEPQSTSVISKYIVGDDINNCPRQTGSRWVVNFWTRDEGAARRFKTPWAIVEERVKPYRDTLTRQVHESCFWKFWDRREAFHDRIRQHGAALVTSKLSKHFCVTFGDPTNIYSEKVKLFDFGNYSALAVLQSVVHTEWALLWGSSTGETPAYVGTSCFDTFPFPPALLVGRVLAHDATDAQLESVGKKYFEHRAAMCGQRRLGFTGVYNLVHSRDEQAADVVRFRKLIAELDRAVLLAYGWQDIDLEHQFVATQRGERYSVAPGARAELLKRLSALNRQRYGEEQASAPAAKPRSTKSRAKAAPAGQGALALVDAFEVEPRRSQTNAASPAKKAGTKRTSR
jgi:hypothetical protein